LKVSPADPSDPFAMPKLPSSSISYSGTKYSLAVVLWACGQSYAIFFPTYPATIQEETFRRLSFLGITFAAAITMYLDIFRLCHYANSVAWEFWYLLTLNRVSAFETI
jgi:hypothetical protein